MQRPFVWITASLIGGAAFASFVTPPAYPVSILLVLFWGFGFVLAVLRKRGAAAAFILISTFLLGALLFLTGQYKVETMDPLAQRYGYDRPVSLRLTGLISEHTPSRRPGERAGFVLEVRAVETPDEQRAAWVPTEGRAIVNWYEPDGEVREGDIVEVRGKLRLLKGFKNPGMFDFEKHMHRRGIYTRMVARGDGAVVVRQSIGLADPAGWKYQLRRKGMEIVSGAVRTEETRAFLSAILLGKRGLLPDEIKDRFKETGTFHILAISGLHIGLVYLMVSLSLSALPLGLKMKAAISILVVWVYAIITGAGIPVTRASIMLTLVLAGYLLDREGDFLTAVAVAAFILVLVEPLAIVEASFQLSFAAVVVLCAFESLFNDRLYPLLQRRMPGIPSPLLHKLAVTLFASLVVGFGLMPIVAYHFNQASLIFPLANLLVIPLLSVVLALGFATLLAGFISMHAAAFFGLGAEAVSQAMFSIVRLFSAAPYSSFHIGSPPLLALGLALGGIACLWWQNDWKRKTVIFGCCSGLGVLSAFVLPAFSGNDFRVTFFDVGEADACLLEFPDGKTMLVDTGFSSEYFSCGEHLIAPFFWRRNIRELEILALTHPDADHCGGAGFLLENFRVRRLALPYGKETSPEFREIVTIAQEQGTAVEGVGAGDEIAVGDQARVEVLNPPKTAASEFLSDNNVSLVLQIKCNGVSVLLTGDVEKEALRLVSRSGKTLSSKILKTPHHGLKSSFSREFLEQVHPDVVIISGRAFRSNDSIEKRIVRYTPFCRRVLATERDGGIEIISDGQTINLKTQRGGRN